MLGLITSCFLREPWDMVACLLSAAFPWAPDRQEPWHLPTPAGTALPLAQYWAQSRSSAEIPGLGLMSLSPEPREICHIQAEKSSSSNDGKRTGSLREAGGSRVHTDKWGLTSASLVPHTVLWQASLPEPPFPQQYLWSGHGG